jgi:hypothetical protein
MKWMKTDFPTQKNSHKKKGAVVTMTAEKCHPKALPAFRWSGGSVGESNPEGRMIKSIVSSQINNQESFGVFLECDRQPFCNSERSCAIQGTNSSFPFCKYDGFILQSEIPRN